MLDDCSRVQVGGRLYERETEWKSVKIGSRGRVLIGDTLCTTECANGTRIWCCYHLDETISLVMNKPEKGVPPKIVFSNNPKVRNPIIRLWNDKA